MLSLSGSLLPGVRLVALLLYELQQCGHADGWRQAGSKATSDTNTYYVRILSLQPRGRDSKATRERTRLMHLRRRQYPFTHHTKPSPMAPIQLAFWLGRFSRPSAISLFHSVAAFGMTGREGEPGPAFVLGLSDTKGGCATGFLVAREGRT